MGRTVGGRESLKSSLICLGEKVLTKSISQIHVSLQYASQCSHLRQGLLALKNSATQYPEPAWVQNHKKRAHTGLSPYSTADTRSAGASGYWAPGETGLVRFTSLRAEL